MADEMLVATSLISMIFCVIDSFADTATSVAPWISLICCPISSVALPV